MNSLFFSSLLIMLSAAWLQAFPPAPYYTLYGTVRDQVGQTLDVEDATLMLLKGGVELERKPQKRQNLC